MEKPERLIRTKLRLPFTRPELVPRLRLQEQITQGLCGPLTLITAPAGFGKTTLVASCVANCGIPVAWLSLDKDDNHIGRFLSYMIAALQGADSSIGNEAEQLMGASQTAPSEAVLTSLINDLDATGREIILVLDDYQFISNQEVHKAVAFVLEHCPNTLHLVIATRSDPPLPLSRLRARGQTVELRAANLSFTELEAAEFLNDIMGLRLDAGDISVLEVRTEGWVAGLQMAALSMRGQEDIHRFIEGFSGTNRYILDYLLEEVLASQPPEIQRFLLLTSILERLTAPLCDTLLASEDRLQGEGSDRAPELKSPITNQSASILEYLERINLFLVPLDDERTWYRYHHLFADLLRAQLHRSLGAQGIAQLHILAADWHGQNGSVLDAIHHASLAPDDARVERFIEQNYMELMSRGELSWIRSWTGELSKELICRRPWLCIYEAQSHAWFGELDEAERLLEEAEKQIRAEGSTPDTSLKLGHLAYVKSRVIAMRGDLLRAIEQCLEARQLVPTDNLALQLDINMTLGYEYFLDGDYANADPILQKSIQSSITTGAIINPVAAYCVLARLHAVQGQLKKSYDLYQKAEQLIHDAGGRHLGAKALIEAGIAEVFCEWNDLEAASFHLQQGMALMPWWGKADDFILAYVTLARIRLAQDNQTEAIEAIEKAVQIVQTRGVFSEARYAVECAQVNLWLAQGDLPAAGRWAASWPPHSSPDNQAAFESEPVQISLARVTIAHKRQHDAISLLAYLEESARSAGRMGRVIEILLLEAFARQAVGDSELSVAALTKCLALAEPNGYVRLFLNEGQPVQKLLTHWLSKTSAGPLRDYAIRLLSQFNAEPHDPRLALEKVIPGHTPSASTAKALVEPLSQRELEVLHHIALGKTNQEIAQQLFVSPGTIKAHTASIYRKLDVANRTEAAARARQLGILP